MSNWFTQLTAETKVAPEEPSKDKKQAELDELINNLPEDQREKFRAVLGNNKEEPKALPPPPPPKPEPTEQEKRELLIRDCLDDLATGNISTLINAIVQGKLDLEFKDSNGYTAMHIAVWRTDKDSVTRLLEDASCPIDIRSDKLQTPLIMSVVRGSLSMMKLFLDRGADIEAKDSMEITPLLASAQTGQLTAFLVLLHRGANLNVVDMNGCNIVHWAAYKNNVSFLRLLKSYGMNFTTPDKHGMTPLHRAAMSNAIDAVEYLLSQGVQIDTKDTRQRTAFDIAKEHHANGAAYLLKHYSSKPSFIYSNFTMLYFIFWVVGYVTYLNYVMPMTAHYLFPSLIFNVTIVMLPILFIAVKCSRSGEIPKQAESSDNPLVRSIGERFEDEEFTNIPQGDSICFSCWILRPDRSKHCRVCNRCIPIHDHHCVFLNKCIGKKNRKTFFLGLSMHYLACISFLYLEWRYYDVQIEAEWFSTYMVLLVDKVMTDIGINILVVICLVGMTWYSLWYHFLEVYAISNALTVNEVLNRHRYRYLYAPYKSIDGSIKMRFKNPFYKSILQNWIEFITQRSTNRKH